MTYAAGQAEGMEHGSGTLQTHAGKLYFFCDRTLLLYHIDHCINVGAEAGAEVGT